MSIIKQTVVDGNEIKAVIQSSPVIKTNISTGVTINKFVKGGEGIHWEATTSGVDQEFTDAKLLQYLTDASINLFKNGVYVSPEYVTKTASDKIKVGVYLEAGDNLDIIATGSATLENSAGVEIAGTDKQVQFNDAGVLGASSNFTYDKTSQTVSATKFSGDGSLLTNVNAETANSVAWGNVSGKPTFSGVASSGDYNDLSNKPVYADVASSGSYNDLIDKPTIPVLPTLSTVATTGDYNDLTNKPVLADVATSASYNDLVDVPLLSPVATTGSYNDLNDVPDFGTASFEDVETFASALQGTKADTAIQSITSTDNSITVTTSGNVRNLSVQYAASSGKHLVSVRNQTGAALQKGTIVYISGAQGNKALVSKSIASTEAGSSKTLGFVDETINNNNVGNVITMGKLTGIPTTGFPDGTRLYLSPTVAGAFTSVKPSAPDHMVFVGTVIYEHVNNGEIEVSIQNGFELEELHNVQIQSVSDQQVIQYDSASGLWKNTSLSDVATTGNYDDLTGKPSLSTVATTGSYNDLLDKPSAGGLPTSIVGGNSNQILYQSSTDNTSFITAPTTNGDVLSWNGTNFAWAPVTSSGTQIQSDWTQTNTASVDFIKNKPVLSTVATSGSYNDLTNKPTIPQAQIQSDWTQANVSSVDFIKNKPTNLSQFTNDTGYITEVSFANVTSKPTTLSGYGITDAQSLDADLTAIAGLTGTSGLLKKTAANTWTLDTNSYLTTTAKAASAVVADSANAVTWGNVSGKPTFATVATTGNYNDLSNRPTSLPGGASNQILFQSQANTTSFIAAPSTANTSLTWNGTNFTWSSIGSGGSSTQVQSDWTQTNTSSPDFIKNKPATILWGSAPTGGPSHIPQYAWRLADLGSGPGVPVFGQAGFSPQAVKLAPTTTGEVLTFDGAHVVWSLPSSGSGSQIQSDWSQTDNSQADYIKNKPELSLVSISGSYNDLINLPTIPTQQPSDWNATTGVTRIINKPTTLSGYGITDAQSLDADLTAIAGLTGTSGLLKKTAANTWSLDTNSYLTTTAKAASATVADSANAVTWGNVSGKPTFATVATSGSYDDLTNKPTIPAAQVESDWNASTGVSKILNKPTFATVATTGSYNDLTNKPNGVTGGASNQIVFQSAANTTSFITAPTIANTTLSWNGTNFTWAAAASGGGGGTTTNALTFVSNGTGAVPTTTFDGSVARNISYNSVGAPSITGANASGTWGISVTGSAATVTGATQNNITKIGTQTSLNVSGTSVFGDTIYTPQVYEKKYAAGNKTGTVDISIVAPIITMTCAGSWTSVVFSNLSSAYINSFILELTNGGAFSITWPSSVKWAGGVVPTLTAAGVDILGFYSHDNGVTWRAFMLAKDSK